MELKEGKSVKSILHKGMSLLVVFMMLIALSPISVFAKENNKKVVRIGLFEDTYNKVNDKGELYGYGYEYIQKIAGYNGWTLEYVNADWYNCFDKLENGEIDILNGISYTEERNENMLFSTLPMAEERYYIYVDTDNLKISTSDLSSIDGKTVGVMEGAIPETILNEWEKDNHIQTMHTDITTAEDVLKNLEQEKMDCFVSVEETWDQSNIMPLTYIGSSDVYYAINKERTDLKEELDDAMSRIFSDNPFYNDELYKKYFSTSTAALLTDDEKSWLKEHGTIRMGYVKEDTNISEKGKNSNEVTGVITDYVDFAKDCLENQKLKFKLVGYDSMQEEITALQKGDIDVVFKVPYNPNYALLQNMSLSDTSMSASYSAITSKDTFDQNAENTIAIAKDDWIQKWYVDYAYPDWNIVEYESQNDVIKAVKKGNADCFVVRTGMSRRYNKDSKWNVAILDQNVQVSFGVKRQSTKLLSVLNKTLKKMPDDTLKNALSVYDSENDTISVIEFIQDNFVNVLVSIVVLSATLILVFVSLKKSKQAENELSEQLAISDNLARNFKNVYLINLNRGTAKILKFEGEVNDSRFGEYFTNFFPYEVFLNKWINKRIHPDDRVTLSDSLDINHLRKVFKTQDEYNGNFRVLVNDKEYNYQYVVSKMDKDGYVLARFQNIDSIIQEQLEQERIQKEKDEAYHQELLRATQDAQKANATKTDFLRRMSHDIRTPINGIRGMIQIADHNIDDKEKVEECHDKIMIATDHLLSLVNDVLDMNKLESGNFTLKHDSFSLSQILEEVYVSTQTQALEYGIEFIHQDSKDIKHDHLLGSPVYMKRIFMNFISNAIKYNREGGTVSVYGKELSCDGKKVLYEFICEDTGIGMSEEFVKHAFEPFTQEEQTSARTKFTGTGLGLSISKSLIELLGGSIELHSKLNVGTKVIFTIPLDIDQQIHETKEDKVDYSHIRFDGIHALLVEDNDLNAEIAIFLLEQHGVKVTWLENGKLAVNEMANYGDEYDVIFMDVMMPVMNGLDATKEIRKLGKEIPIFAMTANAFSDDVQRSLDAGMNEHLTKPLREKDIIRALIKYVGKNEQCPIK